VTTASGRRQETWASTIWNNLKEKPIQGLSSVFAAILFLGDVDINVSNISVVEQDDAFQVVKIDPEGSFSDHFFGSEETNEDHKIQTDAEAIAGALRDPATRRGCWAGSGKPFTTNSGAPKRIRMKQRSRNK
jgi:hypothetical protein